MKRYLAALLGSSLILGAATLSNAQPPPGTDRPKGTTDQTSAYPKPDRSGTRATTKGTTKKATKTKKAKKTRSVKRTTRAESPQKSDRDNRWDRGWDDKGGKNR